MFKQDRFRCYAYRDGDYWYADCLDLRLLVKRETLPDAMRELETQILGYLEAVIVHDAQEHMIPRPVETSDRLVFYWRALLHSLRILLTGHPEGLVAYEIHVPIHDMKVIYA